MTTSSRPPGNAPAHRPEPLILSELNLDDDPDLRDNRQSSRVLSLTLLISLSAHLIILALAAYAASRDSPQVEQIATQPSIQIRFRQPPTPTASNDEEPQPEAPATDETPTIAETLTEAPAAEPTESLAYQAQEPAATEQIDLPPAPVQIPSLTDLRNAARNRVEQNRQNRVTHPDCLLRERRNNYLDCDDNQNHDYARADQNDTLVFFNATLPAEPANTATERTTTGARVKAALDMFDDQLGTTRTKRSIMNFP